ncbi:hypothetical protein BOTBODRAFT_60630 [Botryobasidium botryosum FD-172 SS1]|uniref:F-box domain-containing protein n=1 Tax=Botryobasidium botryosum (strain FD-172 SS1) TaxID=930990 RepID=A0A067M3G6_BOTB1|nr:hypothetical protein BOTBODRAFT_60630 [Botryobasidium botryosum FD-172 SS1]
MDSGATTHELVFHLIHALSDQLGSKHILSTQLSPHPFQTLDESADSLQKLAARVQLAHDTVVAAATSYTNRLLSDIRRHYNRATPIYRLPNEIIAAILEFAARSTNQFLPPCTRAPINVSHVSKRWRDIAVNTPTLWTSINLANATFLRTFLTRSRTALLDIDLALPSIWPNNVPIARQQALARAHEELISRFPHSLRNLRSQIARWRTFAIRGFPARKLGRFLTQPAPQLETLHINGFTYIDIGAQDANSRPLFAGCTPRLRDLCLEHAYVPLDSPIYVGLTRIELNFVALPESPMERFLLNLMRCPALERLALRGAFSTTFSNETPPSLSTPPPPVPVNFNFPYLHELRLVRLDPDFVRRLLTFVSAPSIRTLHIHLDQTQRRLRDFLPPPAVLLCNFPVIQSARSVVMMVSRDTPGDERCHLSGRSDSPRGDFTVVLGNSFSIRSDPTSDADGLGTGTAAGIGTGIGIGSDLPLPELEYLCVSSLDSDAGSAPATGIPGPGVLSTRGFFAPILRDIPTLRSISLDRCPSAFVDVLVGGSVGDARGAASESFVEMQGREHSNTSLVPLVEKIELVGCDIGDDALMALAVSRVPSAPGEGSDDGGRLRRLVLKGCPLVDGSTIRAIRDVMPELEIVWDEC